MQTEYEATFTNIDIPAIQTRLKKSGAKLVRPEFRQKRVAFDLPAGHEIEGGWLRVRDEGDKITMSLKIVSGQKIRDQKEICLTVDNFDQAVDLLKTIGAHCKTYQETKRELWSLDNVEITIDQWPFLEPIIEIEGESEAAIKAVAQKLGFNYAKAKFCSIDVIYGEKYGIAADAVNHTPRIVFGEPNPFLKK